MGDMEVFPLTDFVATFRGGAGFILDENYPISVKKKEIVL